MAKIKVKDIKPTGADLFNDSESFMNELSNDELEQAMGGRIIGPVFSVQKSCNCFPTTGGTKTIIFKTYPCSPVIL
ncbi:MAG: hypothetical protein F6K50_43690 [Moorea sp. SIO3I7]|uniref:hypothetical protein n=1 Tax=unclassified Moorena TaxID=2683338 RepID=UPI0013CD377D|nr:MULTISPECIES: hypothetical protein [unclassified Moorena]NEO02037.1 hypothetical protein [Moorena sp. SIO3I7]NEO12827.1 hypothetical protein [Moorena sp. SIO3E8]NEP28361.1 hypothetical protein [Moorena sp. SIO3I6]NEQ01659.1 hypothetical protein [Moorena sp. SIO3F7]